MLMLRLAINIVGSLNPKLRLQKFPSGLNVICIQSLKQQMSNEMFKC